MATSSPGKRKRKRLTGRKFERRGNKADAVEPDYHTTFCVHVYCRDGLNRWYVLDVSSYKDRRKEDLEKQPLILDTSTISPDLHLAFNHSDRHSESAEDRPTLLPLLSEKKSIRFGTCHAERMRGRDVGGSRKLFFLDANHPEEWTKGPKTIAGRYMAATASIFGKLFVFGGCLPNNGVWAEVLDTARASDADNGGWRWSPLPGGGQCPSDVLGVEELFAIAIYHGDIFCLMWVGDDEHLHTTTLKVSATMTSVVCCHIYSFQEQDDQEQDDQDDCFVAGNIELVKCLQPSLQM